MNDAGPVASGTAQQQQQPDAPLGMPPGLSRRVAASLMAVPLVHGVGQSLAFAILPAVARDLGISETRVGLVYMLPAIAWSLATAWWGHRCDHWDRRPVLLLSLVGFAASTLMFAAVAAGGYAGWYGATVLWLLILGSRLLYSALSSGAMPAAQAYLVEVTAPQRRSIAIGRLNASLNLGTLIGPGVVGVLAVFGVLTPLLAMTAIAVAVWLAIRRSLDAQHPQPHPPGPRARLSAFDPRIRTVLLIGLCASTAQATLMQTLAYFFMDRLGVATADAPRVVGIALMLAALATLFAQTVLVPRLALTPAALQAAGLAIKLAGFVALMASQTTLHAWLATLLCGVAYGLLRPGNVTHASLSVRAHEQGAVAGLNGAVWSAGYVIAPLFAMPLHAVDARLPYAVVLGVLALALAAARTDAKR